MSKENTSKTKASSIPEGPVRVGSNLYRLLEMTAREIAAQMLRRSRAADSDTQSRGSEPGEPSPEKQGPLTKG
jgi:hypothetical protein